MEGWMGGWWVRGDLPDEIALQLAVVGECGDLRLGERRHDARHEAHRVGRRLEGGADPHRRGEDGVRRGVEEAEDALS